MRTHSSITSCSTGRSRSSRLRTARVVVSNSSLVRSRFVIRGVCPFVAGSLPGSPTSEQVSMQVSRRHSSDTCSGKRGEGAVECPSRWTSPSTSPRPPRSAKRRTSRSTVQLPDPDILAAEPVVCFAKPGGGYSKEYFTLDLPGPARGAQSDWHVTARLGVRGRRPPRCRREQHGSRRRPSRLHDAGGREPRGRAGGAASAGRRRPGRRVPAGARSGAARHRPVDGWLPDRGPTGSAPRLRRHRRARLQRGAHASAGDTGSGSDHGTMDPARHAARRRRW